MTFGAYCSLPNSGSISAYYDDTSAVCTPTLASYYANAGDNPTARMRDHLVGAASQFQLPSRILLAQSVQENGGPFGNWLQMGDADCQAFLDEFVTPRNTTGQNLSIATVQQADAINAAAAAWYLQTQCLPVLRYGSLWETLSAALSVYNAGFSNTGDNEGYGLSVLFLAYGDAYSQLSHLHYDGPQVATGPTGTQSRFNTGPTYGPIATPGFSVTSEAAYLPFGTNAAGRRILLFVGDERDYVNGLILQQYLYAQPTYIQAYLTADPLVAATSANAGGDFCVIAIGGAAVSKLEAAAQRHGDTLEEFLNFSSWDSSPNNGYIDASSSTYAGNFQKALKAVEDASQAGWS
jgi:hypothetical protein